jgi:hypothetical protein
MKLPDGALILLTVAVETDRTGKRYGQEISPDEIVPAPATGAPNDPQIDRAIAWLQSQSCT